MPQRSRSDGGRRILASLCVPLALCAGAVRGDPATPGGGARGPFRFVVVGDTQPNNRFNVYPKISWKIADEINDAAPEFVVHVGDIVCGGTGSPQRFRKQLEGFKALRGKIHAPLYVSFGNHDTDSAGAADILRDEFGYLYTSFTHKGAHFILLNSYLPGAYGTIGGEQLEWLQGDLLRHQGEGPIFVFMHLPVISNPRRADTVEPAMRDLLHGIFLRNGVSAAFFGHQHLYYHLRKDGIDYYTTGGGGGRLFLEPEGSFHHFLIVTVCDGRFSVEVKRSAYAEAQDYEWSNSLRFLYWDAPFCSRPHDTIELMRCPPPPTPATPAERLWAQAYASDLEGKGGAAFRLYGRAAERDPRLSGVVNNRAVSFFLNGIRTEGIQMLSDLLSRHPGDETARYNLALMNVMEERPAEALAILRAGPAAEDRGVSFPVVRGLAYEKMGDYRRAEREYRGAIARDPGRTQTHGALITLLFRGGAVGDAVRQAAAMTRRNPGDVSAWMMRGDAHYFAGEYADARSAYQRALDIGGVDARGLNTMGAACLMAGDAPGAQMFFERALRQDEELYEAKFNLALILTRKWRELGESGWASLDGNQIERIIELLKSLASEEAPGPLRACALNNLAVLYRDSNYFDSDVLISHLKRAIDADPSVAIAHANIGSVYWEAGQVGRAGLSFLKALKIEPERPELRCNLALLLLSEGKIDEAIDILRKVLDATPRHCEAWNGLGEAYFSLHNRTPGDTAYMEKAREAWLRSFTLNPHQEYARCRIGALGDGRPAAAPGAPPQ